MKHSLKQNAQHFHFILLHVIIAPVKITHFPHFPIFSDPSKIISLAGAKAISGPRFLLCVFKHLLSIVVKNKNFYEHFSAERWESNIEIMQIYSTRCISLEKC